MRIDRNAVRVVVPPVLALALVALLVHPADASERAGLLPGPVPVSAGR